MARPNFRTIRVARTPDDGDHKFYQKELSVTAAALSFARTSSRKHPVPQNGRLLNGQEIEAPGVDNSPSSDAEDTGEKENKGDKHRPDIKAD